MGSRRASLSVLALAVVGCDRGERSAPEATPRPEAPVVASGTPVVTPQLLLRGVVRVEPTPRFRSCDLRVHAELLDSTVSQIFPNYTWLGASDEDGLYLMARGTYSPRGVIIREVELAALPSPLDGCDVTPDYLVLARGTTPEWQIKIRERGIEVMIEPGPAMSFAPVAGKDSAEVMIYEANSTAGFEEHTLRLLVHPGPCFEGRRAYARMRAEAVLDGQAFNGCAWRGRLP